MIDFRYHLVSIVAIFLALAVGIVVGSTALQGPLESSLRALSKAERTQIDSLITQKSDLKRQAGADQAFAQAASPRLLPGLLTGQHVVIVNAPGADSQVSGGIVTALQQAGAQVTGQISMQQAFFETGAVNETSLTSIAQGLAAAAGLSLGTDTASPQVSGQLAAAQVIAAALVTDKSGAWTATQSNSILEGFAQRGYLQVSNAAGSSGTTLAAAASLAVVIIPSTPPASATDPANLALIALAQQLQSASQGTVVTGPLAGSGPGSAIDEISGQSIHLSTVDNSDQEIGQITVAQALSYLLAGNKPASYGTGPGVFPSPAPSPLPVAPAAPAGTGSPARNPTAGPHPARHLAAGTHPARSPAASQPAGRR